MPPIGTPMSKLPAMWVKAAEHYFAHLAPQYPYTDKAGLRRTYPGPTGDCGVTVPKAADWNAALDGDPRCGLCTEGWGDR